MACTVSSRRHRRSNRIEIWDLAVVCRVIFFSSELWRKDRAQRRQHRRSFARRECKRYDRRHRHAGRFSAAQSAVAAAFSDRRRRCARPAVDVRVRSALAGQSLREWPVCGRGNHDFSSLTENAANLQRHSPSDRCPFECQRFLSHADCVAARRESGAYRARVRRRIR